MGMLVAMQANIYLSEELAARVRGVEGLNVSKICQEALRLAVEDSEARTEASSDLEQAAARLRKSHGNWEHAAELLGIELGARWAKENAEWDGLVALEQRIEGLPVDPDVIAKVERSAAAYLAAIEEGPTKDLSGDDPFVVAFFRSAVETFQAIRRLM